LVEGVRYRDLDDWETPLDMVLRKKPLANRVLHSPHAIDKFELAGFPNLR